MSFPSPWRGYIVCPSIREFDIRMSLERRPERCTADTDWTDMHWYPVADGNVFLETWQENTMVRKLSIVAVTDYMVNTLFIHHSIPQVYLRAMISLGEAVRAALP